MRSWSLVGVTFATGLLGAMIVCSALQAPSVRSVDESILREYGSVYQWEPNAFVYLQTWSKFTGTNQLVSFDESGELRQGVGIDH